MLDEAAQDVEDLRLQRHDLALPRERHRPQIDAELPEFISNRGHHQTITVSFTFHHDAGCPLRALCARREDGMHSIALIMTMALAAGSAASSVYFVLDENGGVIVPVTVGPLQGLRFLLDTGSTRSVVSETVAQQLTLRPAARTEMVTTAGTSMAVVVAMPETCLAAHCSHDALAIVASKGALGFGSGQLDGVLGGDVLNRDFTIDYRRRRFTWDDGADAQRKDDRLPMSVEDGRAVVTIPQEGRPPLRLVADSGANALVLFDSDVVRSLGAGSSLKRLTTLQTLGGTKQAEPLAIPALRIAGATWRNEIAVVVPRPAGYPEEIDGIMPLHRFAEVSFRFSDGSLFVRHR
jgi:predicted aspartyl protease